MLETERKNKIKSIANHIFKKSKNYFLSHSVMAVEKYIYYKIKKDSNDELQEIANEIKKKRGKLTKERKAILEKRKNYILKNSSRFHIFVDYIDISEDSGRAILVNNKNIEISLSKSLIEEEDNLDKHKKLRKILAHELGHIMLHRHLLDKSTNGTQNINTHNEEIEANLFATTLLELKSKFYKETLENKEYLDYF